MTLTPNEHPFSDNANTPDAKAFMDWIHARRPAVIPPGVERCQAHLTTCKECLRRLVSQLADPEDDSHYVTELLYMFELADAIDDPPPEKGDMP